MLWRRSIDAVLLLPPGSAEPLTLTGTGPDVWDLLDQPSSLSALVHELATRYDADPTIVEADLRALLAQLRALSVVEPVPDGG